VGEGNWTLALDKVTWLRDVMSTNGKSAIALEESVICSKWELSSDMFMRILKLWMVMDK
jgi:hypothetical protein